MYSIALFHNDIKNREELSHFRCIWKHRVYEISSFSAIRLGELMRKLNPEIHVSVSSGFMAIHYWIEE